MQPPACFGLHLYVADSVSLTSLDWSLQHIRVHSDTDLFPRPFEIDCVAADRPRLRTFLASVDLETYRPARKRVVPVPKASHGFRMCSQLELLDCILITAALHEHSSVIEAKRFPQSRNVVFSNRILPDAQGTLFDNSVGWKQYQATSKELCLSNEYTHVLLTDISDFYNQLSLHQVENALESAGVDYIRSTNIEDFFISLNAKHSRGLPVGPNASRILSELAINDVDDFISSQGFLHVRYVDDIRIFCRSYADAWTILESLYKYLYTTHRLTLQVRKTRILKADTFLENELDDPDEAESRLRAFLEDTRVEELLAYWREMIREPYVSLSQDDLDNIRDESRRESIANLWDFAFNAGEIDYMLVKHLLIRSRSLRSNILLSRVLENFPLLMPVFKEVVRYLIAVKRSFNQSQRSELSRGIQNSAMSRLEYIKLWLQELYLEAPEAVGEEFARAQLEAMSSSLGKRALALWARKHSERTWVAAKKETWASEHPDTRRALIYAATALARREREFWLAQVVESGDHMDIAVANAVKAGS